MKYKTSWQNGRLEKKFPQLNKSIEVDVLVIGGGMAGLLTAYSLVKAGEKVVLIDKHRLGEGVTYRTTAFLTEIIDTNFYDLIKKLGKKRTGLILESHEAAINFIEKIVRSENIDCEFKRCSNYIYTNTTRDKRNLLKEYGALKELGMKCELNPKKRLGFREMGFIEVKNQAKFHPLKFMEALARIITKNGGRIFEHTEALEIENKDQSLRTVRTPKGRILTPWVVIATHRPFDSPPGLYLKKGLYISYVCELRMEKDALIEGIYEDTENPYHYFRVDSCGKYDRVILGGEDHRADIPMDEKKKFGDLWEYAERIFMGLNYEIVRCWWGPILEPVDGLAYIGLYKDPNIIYAMAFSGNGMTYSGITALMARDLIKTGKNKWQEIYDVGRIPFFRLFVTKGKDYSEEMWNGVIKKIF